ncbi:11821_t:CDS:1, partial [Racocetra fulgida]
MPWGHVRENLGPCAICSTQKDDQIYKKLTNWAVEKANQSPNNSFLQFIFKENDQLCIKHYNEFVIHDRNNRKSKRKKKNQDSSYHNTTPRKKICVELNEYEELLNISKEINILKEQISILNTEKDES